MVWHHHMEVLPTLVVGTHARSMCNPVDWSWAKRDSKFELLDQKIASRTLMCDYRQRVLDMTLKDSCQQEC